jgi:hypothetical protein
MASWAMSETSPHAVEIQGYHCGDSHAVASEFIGNCGSHAPPRRNKKVGIESHVR